MQTVDQTKACAFCAETIGAAAKICPFCGSGQKKGTILLTGTQRPFGGLMKMPTSSEATNTKPCAWCAEPIRIAAKVCPYCRRLQPRWKFKSQVLAFAPPFFFILLMYGGMFWLGRTFGPGQDFDQFRARIVIIDSEMHFSYTTNGNFISAIGHIRNDSKYAWKEVQLEVQYFDKDSRLIDTRSENKYGETLPVGAVHAFRIRAPADKPELRYVSHKVFVRAAKDARKWP